MDKKSDVLSVKNMELLENCNKSNKTLWNLHAHVCVCASGCVCVYVCMPPTFQASVPQGSSCERSKVMRCGYIQGFLVCYGGWDVKPGEILLFAFTIKTRLVRDPFLVFSFHCLHFARTHLQSILPPKYGHSCPCLHVLTITRWLLFLNDDQREPKATKESQRTQCTPPP